MRMSDTVRRKCEHNLLCTICTRNVCVVSSRPVHLRALSPRVSKRFFFFFCSTYRVLTKRREGWRLHRQISHYSGVLSLLARDPSPYLARALKAI